MIKNVILLIGLFFCTVSSIAQKSVIDLFLEQNPGIEQQATCVNISDEMLRMYYASSKLTPPERYQSLSLCNAISMIEQFQKNDLFRKNYTQLMEIKKDDGRIIRYFQHQQEKKRKIIREIVICMQYRNDFSAIYLRGVDLSTQSLNQHLDLIRSFIDKNKCINTHINY